MEVDPPSDVQNFDSLNFSNWTDLSFNKEDISKYKKLKNLSKILWDLLELALDETSTLYQIRSLFDTIAVEHSKPEEYTHRDHLKRYLHQECNFDPSQTLTEQQRDRVVTHIMNWRIEHIKLVLDNNDDKVDATFDSVGCQYSDVIQNRKVIGASKKVYDEFKLLYDSKCAYLTSDIDADIERCNASFQKLSALIHSVVDITIDQWTDSKWNTFCTNIHFISQCINRLATILKCKEQFRMTLVLQCKTAKSAIMKELAKVKFANLAQNEASQLNKLRATKDFGRWTRFASNFIAFSMALFQNHFNASNADEAEQVLRSLCSDFDYLERKDFAREFDSIFCILKDKLCPKLDEYFFFDLLKLHLLVSKQSKLYIELWWIERLLQISSLNSEEAIEKLTAALDELKESVAELEKHETDCRIQIDIRNSRQNPVKDQQQNNKNVNFESSAGISTQFECAHAEMALSEYQIAKCNFQIELITLMIGEIKEFESLALVLLQSNSPETDENDDSTRPSLASFQKQNDILFEQSSQILDQTISLIEPLRQFLCNNAPINQTAIEFRSEFQQLVEQVYKRQVETNMIANQAALHVAQATKLFIDYQKLIKTKRFPEIALKRPDLNKSNVIFYC